MISSRKSGQAERAEPGVGDRDHLGVERGIVDADRLDADLLQLAVAARLRALVAEERPGVAELDRQRAAVQSVLDHRADDAGRAFGPQRDRAVTAVGERVHLLGDHIGGFADAAGEQRGVLEDRQLDVAVAGQPRGFSSPSRTATNSADSGGR